MTPLERAEKIRIALALDYYATDGKKNRIIAAEIEEAVKEAIDDIALGLREDELTQRIRAQVFEEAAKIVQNKIHLIPGTGVLADSDFAKVHKLIADLVLELRRRAAEGEGK